MGLSVDLYIYNYENLIKKFMEIGADSELLKRILTECGSVSGNKYVLLNNEHYDSSNPFNTVCDLIDSAFNIKDSIDIFLEGYEIGINYIDRYEASERLGIYLKGGQ